MIFKVIRQRLVDQLVITVIFAFVLKRRFHASKSRTPESVRILARSLSERNDNVTAPFRPDIRPTGGSIRRVDVLHLSTPLRICSRVVERDSIPASRSFAPSRN